MAIVEQRGETPARPGAAHVVVVASEKGGTGKSTLAIHIAVALLKAGRHAAAAYRPLAFQDMLAD
jgi:Mrp family chromosome partitioning ATPase